MRDSSLFRGCHFKPDIILNAVRVGTDVMP